MRVNARGLGHRFGTGHWLFRGLSADFDPGHVYALTGPSGSGKSTLLSLLAGWETPVEGEVERRGDGKVTWVFQNPHGVPGRSALDHVALPGLGRGARPAEAEAEARLLLDRFRLAQVADRPFSALSGGEAQRLMLARGIASDPALLLVDEPTAQLDLATSAEVNDALARISTEDTIVIVATHDERTRDACTDVIDLREYQVAVDVEVGTGTGTAECSSADAGGAR